MPKTNAEVNMKLLKVCWSNETSVCTISPNFEIYFLSFPWELKDC